MSNEVVVAEVVLLDSLPESREMELVDGLRLWLDRATTNEERGAIRSRARAIRAAAREMDAPQVKRAAEEVIAEAEHRIVADTPRVGHGPGAGKKTNTDVSVSSAEYMELSRMRAVYEGITEEELQEALVSHEQGESITRKSMARKLGKVPRMAEGTGNDERWTPAHVIEAARRVLGAIDLDPASCAEANDVVGATVWHGEDDDGLTQEWAGRVWLNPPWSQPLCRRFTAKLIAEPAVTAWVTLTHGTATDTAWWQALASASKAICTVSGRLDFMSHRSNASGGSMHSVIVCAGGTDLDAEQFVEQFSSLGTCWIAS